MNNVKLKNKIEYLYAPKLLDINAYTHLGYSIDNLFARCTGTSIYSFIKNNPERVFYIHIITSGLNKEQLTRFEELAREHKINITIYVIDTEFLDKLHLDVSIKWPLAVYFRFLYEFLLPKEVQRLNYIDGDILCLNSCNEFFNIDLEDNIIAGVNDLGGFVPTRINELKLTHKHYFNAGIIIIDLYKWRKFGTWKKLLDLVKAKNTPFKSQDQDILNVIFNARVKIISDRFNFQFWNKSLTKKLLSENYVCLLHIGGYPKPWQIIWPYSRQYNKITKDIYREYEQETPWSTVPLDLPNDYKDKRLYAKYLWSTGKYLKALQVFMEYSLEKAKYKVQR